MKRVTIALDKLRINTAFEHDGVTYKKTTSCRGDEVEVTPQYGGQWQDDMQIWLSVTTQVTVTASNNPEVF